MSINKIPEETYKKIVENIPLCCVDGLLHYGNKIILFKRKYEPAKGRWWFFGGRVLKGEDLETAIKRKAAEELGIEIRIEKQIKTYSTIFEKNRFGFPVHTINTVFLVTSDKKPNFEKAEYEEFDEVKEFDIIEKDWPEYIKKAVMESRVFG